MIKISDEFKEAWLQGHQKYIQLDFSDGTSLADNDVVGESLKIEQSLCTEEQLVFGLVASSKFTVQVYNAGKRYVGLSVTPQLAAFENGQYYIMSFGTYKIAEDKRSDDRNYRTITAYDALYDVVGEDYAEWYNGFYNSLLDKTGSGKCTLREFRDAFFDHIGVEQVETSLLNDDAVTVGKNDVETFSGSDIIRCICEPNGAFGFLNYDGKFQYVQTSSNAPLFPDPKLFPSESIFPGGEEFEFIGSGDANSKPSSIIYEDFYTHEITQAKWRETDRNADVVYGEDGNCYEFQDNYLFYEVTEDALRGIAKNFVDNSAFFWYVPSKIHIRGRPWIQLGDLIAVNDGKDSVMFPVLSRTFSGVTATYDDFEAKGTEYFAYSANSLGRTIADFEHYNGTTEVRLQKNEEDITAEVVRARGSEEELAARIKIEADRITQEVSARQGADETLKSTIEQTAQGLTVEISKRTTEDDVHTLISADASSIRLQTTKLSWSSANSSMTAAGHLECTGARITGGTFSWSSTYSSMTESGDFTANNAYLSNVTLGDSVYLALGGKYDKYARLAATYDNTVVFYKGSGSDNAKIRCGAVDTDRINTNGVTIDETDGNIDADGRITCYRVNCEYMRADSAKNRAVQTNYGKVALYAYETPTPLFGDVGRGVLDDNGVCVINIDGVFFETIVPDVEYDVFLQPYGEGQCYVSERSGCYFVVEGTPNMKFAWEVKMAQKGLDTTRLEDLADGSVMDEFPSEGLPRYDTDLLNYIDYEEDSLNDLLDELLLEG